MTQILTVVATALLTAALNILVSQYNTRMSYRNEYHKKIIDQRMETYGKVGALLTLFPFEYSWDQPPMRDDLIGRENYLKIFKLLEELSWNGYWASPNLRSAIIDFYRLVGGFRDWMSEKHPNFPVEQMVRHDREIDVFRKRILSSYTLDMENCMIPLGFFEKREKCQ